MRRIIVLAVVALLANAALVLAQTPHNSGFVLSPMHVTALKAVPYLYVSEQTTLDTIGEVLDKRLNEMNRAIKDGAFLPSGPPVFVYHNAGRDRSKPFTLDVGFPVAENTVAAGDYQLGKLESERSATAVYVGPINQIGQAYGQLFGQIFGAGYMPSGIRRERYLYWEDADSSNNVILIEVLLQK